MLNSGFPATCVNVRTCNSPEWTDDALGNRTNYSYDATHGGVTQILQPAVAGGRPDLRIAYQTVSGTAVPLRTRICAVQQVCEGSASETVTEFAFDTALNLTTQTVRAGNSSIAATSTMTYDAVGNLLTVDGPLAGAADTTRYRYDAARRVVGIAGPHD